MQITIDPPPDPEEDLIYPTTLGSISQWSDLVLSYEGAPDFLALESYRNELLPPHEPCTGDAKVANANECNRDRPAQPAP